MVIWALEVGAAIYFVFCTSGTGGGSSTTTIPCLHIFVSVMVVSAETNGFSSFSFLFRFHHFCRSSRLWDTTWRGHRRVVMQKTARRKRGERPVTVPHYARAGTYRNIRSKTGKHINGSTEMMKIQLRKRAQLDDTC